MTRRLSIVAARERELSHKSMTRDVEIIRKLTSGLDSDAASTMRKSSPLFPLAKKLKTQR
jgi:hypothetical protein